MDDQPALPRPTVNPWVVLVVGSLSAFMVFLDAQVLFVAFDDIRSSFPSVSFATMSWTLSAYTIALAAALVLALVLGIRLLPESREADRARFPDPLGIALLAGSLTLLALGIVQSDQWGWTAPATLAALAGGLLVLAVFVRRTLSVPHPALDLRIFARPSVRWANIATAAFTIGFTAMFFALIQFTLAVWDYSVVRAGLAMMPGPMVVMVLAPLLGRVAAHRGQRALLVPGGLVYAASGVFLLTRLGDDPAYVTQLLPASLLSGLGVAMVIPQLTSAAVQGLPPDEFGAGAAVNQAIRQLGATFGVALTVAVLGTVTPTIAADAFGGVWAMLVICGVLTSVAAVSLPRRQPAVRAVAVPVVAGAPQ
jgi:predicted MFS family arabinose efflux permease